MKAALETTAHSGPVHMNHLSFHFFFFFAQNCSYKSVFNFVPFATYKQETVFPERNHEDQAKSYFQSVINGLTPVCAFTLDRQGKQWQPRVIHEILVSFPRRALFFPRNCIYAFFFTFLYYKEVQGRCLQIRDRRL